MTFITFTFFESKITFLDLECGHILWALLKLCSKFIHYEKSIKFEKISHFFLQDSCFYSVESKQVGNFFKFLWPFQKSWTFCRSLFSYSSWCLITCKYRGIVYHMYIECSCNRVSFCLLKSQPVWWEFDWVNNFNDFLVECEHAKIPTDFALFSFSFLWNLRENNKT